MKKKKRALLLFSGGLDSILAAKILLQQNIEVTGLVFASYFFGTSKGKKAAEEIGIPVIEKDISRKHFLIVKKPRFGYGSAMNPCIDCHAMMLKEASRIAKKEGYNIIATGEVLGQRPMSQNRRAFELIEKATGMKKKILRPLSARVLEETDYESKGLVQREELESIEGRSRKRQMELAKKWEISYYPTPSGGCRLTEKEFSSKLKEMMEKQGELEPHDFQLIRIGRHFYLSVCQNTSKNRSHQSRYYHLILGRNAQENEMIETLARNGDCLISREDRKGPIALIRHAGVVPDKIMKKAKQYILDFSKNHPLTYADARWTVVKQKQK